MTNNIRSLHSRLKRLERKSGVGSARAFYESLSDEVLWAILAMPLDSSDDERLAFMSTEMGWSEKKTAALLANMERFNAANLREFRQYSDEQLLEMIDAPFEAA